MRKNKKTKKKISKVSFLEIIYNIFYNQCSLEQKRQLERYSDLRFENASKACIKK